MDFFNCAITAMDGTVEVIEFVTNRTIDDGVLSLYQKETAYGPHSKHLGSWPLCNIRKWEMVQR